MNIPKKIHFTFPSASTINPLFRENIQKIKNDHKDWEVSLYSDEDRIEFISKNYDEKILYYFQKLNPDYGPARADFFRYLLMFKLGGVYLDVKSGLTKNLNDIINNNDKFLLSHWGKSYPNWGRHKSLGDIPCFQQWFIICQPSHPFLSLTISKIIEKIKNYSPRIHGVGKPGVLQVTGTIVYTKCIHELIDLHEHRIFDSEKSGLKYSIIGDENKLKHQDFFKNHYSRLSSPIVLNYAKDHLPKNNNTISWNAFKSKSYDFELLINSIKSQEDPFFESVLVRNLILFLSGNELQSINNLTRNLYRKDVKKFILNFYLTMLTIISDRKKKRDKTFSNLIFGLGTGRSGSTSLSFLLSLQEKTFSSHEYPPLVDWKNDRKNVLFHLSRSLILLNTFNFVADVSHWWLPYVEFIIEKFPNSIFVCIQREKKETVSSFLRIKGNGKKGTLNHWTPHDGKYWRHNNWDETYPKFQTHSLQDALESYWDEYYSLSQNLERKFPNHFRIFNIKNLSSDKGQLEILRFCKFPNPKINLAVKKNVNSIDDGETGWNDIKKLFHRT